MYNKTILQKDISITMYKENLQILLIQKTFSVKK